MSPYRIAACVVCGSLLAGLARAAPEALRVLSIRPDSHDYVLMSAMGSKAQDRVFTVNDRSGRTHFVHEGDHLGEFTVVQGTYTSRKTYDPTLQATRTDKEIRLRLRDEHGAEITLVPEVPIPRPGFRAVLVDTLTGRAWDVRAGDTIEPGATAFDVLDVQESGVVVREGSAAYPVALASQDERAGVEALWARQRAERKEQLRVAELARQQKAREEAERQAEFRRVLAARQAARKPTRIGATLQGAPQYCFGSEYRYPVEWQVLPLASSPGQPPQVLVLPSRFSSRMTTGGVSISLR